MTDKEEFAEDDLVNKESGQERAIGEGAVLAVQGGQQDLLDIPPCFTSCLARPQAFLYYSLAPPPALPDLPPG